MKLNNNDKIKLIISFFLILLVVFIAVNSYLLEKSNNSSLINQITNNVTLKEQVQYITIESGGGFKPEVTIAKSGIKTILTLKNNGKLDCSNSVKIPDLGIQNDLIELNGKNEYEISNPKEGEFNGSCAMGMYDFKIKFI